IARVDPRMKVDLVDAYRAAGDVVAMTGDGVNDAPALSRADIGVALAGEMGTDVAREAAEIVVTNGDLGTIAGAVREGRRIYRNLMTVVAYLLTGNVSEVLVVVGSLLVFPELAVPLLPVQLLWLNLVTDGLPALALGVDRAPADPLDGPPRQRDEALLSRQRVLVLFARALVIAIPVLVSGVIAHRAGWDSGEVRTQLLLSLLCAHLLLAYASRARRWTFERGWWRNAGLLAAVAGSLLLQVPAFATSVGRSVLGLAPLPPGGWALAAVSALVAVFTIDLARMLARRRVVARPLRAARES
ncbi:MAG: HAD-IC family P-type ATPase, partial [Acidimicrobiia bacterium]